MRVGHKKSAGSTEGLPPGMSRIGGLFVEKARNGRVRITLPFPGPMNMSSGVISFDPNLAKVKFEPAHIWNQPAKEAKIRPKDAAWIIKELDESLAHAPKKGGPQLTAHLKAVRALRAHLEPIAAKAERPKVEVEFETTKDVSPLEKFGQFQKAERTADGKIRVVGVDTTPWNGAMMPRSRMVLTYDPAAGKAKLNEVVTFPGKDMAVTPDLATELLEKMARYRTGNSADFEAVCRFLERRAR